MVSSNLESLCLSSNGLTAAGLPDGVFDELSNLEDLDLSTNVLGELPDGVFDNLSSLVSLYVDGNDLSELPDGVFDNLSSLGETPAKPSPLMSKGELKGV